MKKFDFEKPIGEDGVRNWSGVLKFQRPLNYTSKKFEYDLLVYDKEREHETLFPLSVIPTLKDRKWVFNSIFHGEPKAYWLVHIKDGVWHLAREVEASW